MRELCIDGDRYDCVVFDVDGVLVNNFFKQFAAFAEVIVKEEKYSGQTLLQRFLNAHAEKLNDYFKSHGHDDPGALTEEMKIKILRNDFTTIAKNCSEKGASDPIKVLFRIFGEIASGFTRDKQIRRLFDFGDYQLTEGNCKCISKLKKDAYDIFLQEKNVEVFEEMIGLVQFLKEQDISVAFCSGSTSARKVLELAGILKHFDAAVYPKELEGVKADEPRPHHCIQRKKSSEFFEEVGTEAENTFHGKDAEIAYIKAAKLAGLGDGKHFLVLEDSPKAACKKELKQMCVVYIGTDPLTEGSTTVAAFTSHKECADTLKAAFVDEASRLSCGP